MPRLINAVSASAVSFSASRLPSARQSVVTAMTVRLIYIGVVHSRYWYRGQTAK